MKKTGGKGAKTDKKLSTAAPNQNVKPASKGVSKAKKKEEEDSTQAGDEFDEWTQPKQLIKPSDQLELTEVELKEEFTRILTANNPHAPNNIVRFSHKDKTFKPLSSVDQLAIHFSMDGNMLHKESDEAKRQLTKQGVAVGSDSEEEDENEEDTTEADTEGKEAEKTEASTAPQTEKKLTNQFNYCERASQTYNNPYRERETQTEPPPRANFSATANQWEIYDAYVEDLRRQEKNKEKETKKANKKDDDKKKKMSQMESQ
ncbi:Hypothetical predicted protein, partial [Paramuricea clavata]